MSERNEDVLGMIAQLKARLLDLENDVCAFEGELPDMARRIDHIDDKVYLLELEIESRAQAARGDAQAVEKGVAAQDAASAAGQSEDAKRDRGAQAPETLANEAARPSKSASTDGASSNAASSEDDSEHQDDTMHILTPEAKAKIGETVGDLAEIGKSGMETLADLNEALGDITAPFKSLKKFGRRRF